MNKTYLSDFPSKGNSLQISILNGPVLNMLGKRPVDIYGANTLDDIHKVCKGLADAKGAQLDFRQSNHEGDLVGWIQEASEKSQGLILNAAGLTHTSVSIYDALEAIDIPVIEVHLSQPLRRESFRRKSYISPHAHGVIAGFGINSYIWAVEAIFDLIEKNVQERLKNVRQV